MIKAGGVRPYSDIDPLRSTLPPASLRRDSRFDVLRGWCVAALVVDHIGGWSPLFLLTGGGAFYVTAAEGFVCISGFLVGAVYRRLDEDRGSGAVWRRALARALLLYALMVGTTALVSGEGTLAKLSYWHAVASPAEFLEFMMEVATFRYWLHHTRILGMYSLLLLLVPLLVGLLRRGATTALLVGSWALYAAYQASPARMSWPFPLESGFHPYAYQLLFVHCAAIGYHRGRAREMFHRWQRPLLWLSALVFGALLVIFAWQALGEPSPAVRTWLQRLFMRDFLRPGRLLATACVATLSFAAVTRFTPWVDRHLSPILSPIGRHSLLSYVVHLPFVVFFDWLSPRWQGYGLLSYALNAQVQLAVLAGVWGLVRACAAFAEAGPRWKPRAQPVTWVRR
jgi:hypothetical protein